MIKTKLRKLILRGLEILFFPLILSLLIVNSFFAKIISQLKKKDNFRFVCGSVPIINNSHWAKALRRAGYVAQTYTQEYYLINERSDWDKVLNEEYLILPTFIKPLIAFGSSMYRYDIFIISFNGFFIGHTLLNRFQNILFKIANKKTIVIPYGQDVYVYKNIQSSSVVHGLMSSYPLPSRQQSEIGANVEYWTRNADIVIPGFLGFDGVGRWDVLTTFPFFLDADIWKSKKKL